MRKKGNHKSRFPLEVPALTPEEEQELDFDVCCCIEEIESILLKNPTEKQKKMAETSIKILKSPNEVYIKKKQLMRQWCGDYKRKFDIKKKQITAGLNEHKYVFKKPKACHNSMCFRKHKCENVNVVTCGSEISESSVNNEQNRDSTKVSNSSFKFGFGF